MLKDDKVRQPQRDITHAMAADADTYAGLHGQTTALYRIEMHANAQPYPRKETIEVRQHFNSIPGGYAIGHNDIQMPNLPFSRAFNLEEAYIPGPLEPPLLIEHDYGYWPMVQVVDWQGLDRAVTGIYIRHLNLYALELWSDGSSIETATVFLR